MFDVYLLFGAIALAAIISVVVWIDYFRHIDVFESERIRYLLFALFIGCFTPFISIYIYNFHKVIGFEENGKPFNDLIYSIIGIGLTEELSKVIGVIVVFRILRKHINESIDYLIYAGMVAIGFAMVENVFYIGKFGIDVITNRSFYSVLEHIINTSIITYGFYRFKIFNKGNHFKNTIIAFITAISSHGLFDYFISNPTFKFFSPVLVIGVYLVGINLWITMLNNAVNFSAYFDYSKIYYSSKLFYRLLIWYFFTMLIGLIYKTHMNNFIFALTDSLTAIFSNGFLFAIVILRASRFKIYKNYYQKVTVKLPFYITKNEDEDFKLFKFLTLKIRGENSFEYFLTAKIGQKIELFPINSKKSFIHKPEMATVCDKLFLKGETTVYVILFEKNNTNEYFFLKPKTHDKTMIDDSYPIHQLLQDKLTSKGSKKLSELKFLEWVYLKTEDEITDVNY